MDLKKVLSEILNNSVTKFELCNVAHQLNCDIVSVQEFENQKTRVKKEVLIHLLREASDDERQFYQDLLDETDFQLQLRTKKEKGYPCTYTGCSYITSEHRYYITHLKNTHFLKTDYLCNFARKCKQRFSSIKLLEEHFSHVHSKKLVSTRNLGEDPQSVDVAGVEPADGNDGAGHDLELSTPCKCPLPSCGQQQFPNITKLRKHYSSSVHSAEVRQCLFLGCEKIFPRDFKTRQHFSRCHSKTSQMILKPEFVINVPRISVDNTVNFVENPGREIEEEGDLMEIDENNEDFADETEDFGSEGNDKESSYFMFLKAYADFLNRLAFVQMVPQSTIQIITQEYHSLCSIALGNRKDAVAKRLKQEKVPDNIIPKILAELDNDDCLKAQEELDTVYKREKFIKEHFPFNSPVEVILNPEAMKKGESKESFQYVPMKHGVKILFEDPTFVKVLEKSRNEERSPSDNDLLKEIKDGSLLKSLPYYQQHPESYCGLLYSDAVEIVSPLGSSRGRHKVLQMFWSIGDLPKQFRSKVDNNFLCLIVQDSLLKKYGYQTIYKPLINDLKELETAGVFVSKPFPRLIKISFPLHIGDNLESHSLGGFSRCFSSKDICRFCHCTYEELESKIHDHTCQGPHRYWTIEEYDSRAVAEPQAEELVVVTEENLFNEIDEPGDVTAVEVGATENPELVEENEDQYGLREVCPLNALQSFHAVYSLPPDSLHDILEGVAAEDLLSALKILINKKYFTQDQYNRAMKRHKYLSYESSDRPELIDTTKQKLKGKALSILCHLRNYGFFISYIKPREEIFNEEAFILIKMLHSIVELVMASEIRKFEVAQLEEESIMYLNMRKNVRDETEVMLRAKPKTHYMSHYGEAMSLYGPLVGVWTARYEAKHRVAKMMSTSAKNFINISKTLAVRQQFRQASMMYAGLFETEDIKLPSTGVKMKSDLPVVNEESSIYNKLRTFMDQETVLCDEISYKGQKYRTEDVVVIEARNRNFCKVGVIQAILVKSETVYFLIMKYDAFRDENLQFFEASPDPDQGQQSVMCFIQANNISDYKPLIKHGSVSKFRFALHHHISVSCNSNNFSFDPTQL